MFKACVSAAVLAAVVCPVSAQSGPDDVLVLEHKSDKRTRDALYRKLARLRIDVNFTGIEARELARYLASAAGDIANFVVMTKEEIEPIELELRRASIPRIMAVIQSVSDLRFAYAKGIVKLVHKDEIRPYVELRTYDVRSATTPIPNRPGPKLGLRGPGDEDIGFEDEDDESKVTMSGLTTDKLVEIVRAHVQPESWDREGISIEDMRGQLIVRQSARGHRDVVRLLQQLGALPVTRYVVRPGHRRSPGSLREINRRRLRVLEELERRKLEKQEREAAEKAKKAAAKRG